MLSEGLSLDSNTGLGHGRLKSAIYQSSTPHSSMDGSTVVETKHTLTGTQSNDKEASG